MSAPPSAQAEIESSSLSSITSTNKRSLEEENDSVGDDAAKVTTTTTEGLFKDLVSSYAGNNDQETPAFQEKKLKLDSAIDTDALLNDAALKADAESARKAQVRRERAYFVYLLESMTLAMFTSDMNLTKIQAPVVITEQGINDGLNGTEKIVTFNVPEYLHDDAFVTKQCDSKMKFTMVRSPADNSVVRSSATCEITQSLAKYKRSVIINDQYPVGSGVVAMMTGIRTDEDVIDDIHSNVLHQYDWEMRTDDKSIDGFLAVFKKLYQGLVKVNSALREAAKITDQQGNKLPAKFQPIHAESLIHMYPDCKTAKEREYRACKDYGAVVIIGIGSPLSDGQPHDGRAPDYDNHTTPTYPPRAEPYTFEEHGLHPSVPDPSKCFGLNGDFIAENYVLGRAVELQSFGNRVTPSVLMEQLKQKGRLDDLKLPYHQLIMDKGDEYSTCGGGLGVERWAQFVLGLKHIGEAYPCPWPVNYRKYMELHHPEIDLL